MSKKQNQKSGRQGGFGPGRIPVQKPKNFKKSIKRLARYLRPHSGKLVIVFVAAVLSTLFSVLGPVILGRATTIVFDSYNAKYFDQSASTFDYSGLLMIVITLIVLYAISSLFSYIQQYIMANVAQGTVYNLRKDLKEKLGRLPLKYFDSRTHGEVLSRMTNDIDLISTTLSQSITQIITAVILLVGITVMMLTISPLLTLIIFLSLPLSIFVTMPILKRSQKYFKEQQKYVGNLNGHVEEMYTGHKIVKAFGQEEDAIEKFETINSNLYGAGWKALFISGIIMPLMTFINNLSYVLVSVVGAILVIRGKIKIGDIQAFIQYTRRFSEPIRSIAQIANVLQSTVAAAERVFEILDEEELEQDTNEPRISKTPYGFVKPLDNEVIYGDNRQYLRTEKGYLAVHPDLSLKFEQSDRICTIYDVNEASLIGELVPFPKGHVKFNSIEFGYKPDEILMDNLNINVLPGQTIAIVGPTGAGKTTLVNLLMRFYEVSDGQITIDGVTITDFKRGDLRSIFGMVLQDTWLFKGTIRDNIVYGQEHATEDEIIEAARAAEADHFIRTLPDGYDTVINEEASNISQGQKQLLTIARALLANPSILILDEATSSVDTRTEVHIQKAMTSLMQGRTNFVIAHRLSTIRDANLILVMNHGSIVEKGTHDELLAQDGFYADLYNSQFTKKILA